MMNQGDIHHCWIRVGGLEGITYSIEYEVAKEFGLLLEQLQNGNGHGKQNPIEFEMMFPRHVLLRYSQLWRDYQESNNDEKIRRFLATLTDTNLRNIQELMTLLDHPIKRAIIGELELRNKQKKDDKPTKEKEKLSGGNENMQHLGSSTANERLVSCDIGPSNKVQERLRRKWAEQDKVARSKVNLSGSSHAKEDEIKNLGDGRDVAPKSVADSESAVAVASTSTSVVSCKNKKKREKKKRAKKDATLEVEEISSHSSSTFEVCAGPEDAHHMTPPSSYLDRKVLVLLQDGRKLLGTLRSFDQFANSVLEGACDRVIVGDLYCDIPLGLYVIRGENVVLIGELDLEKEELPPHMTLVSEAEIKTAQKAEREATNLKGASAIAEDRIIDNAINEESWIVEDGDLEDIPDPEFDRILNVFSWRLQASKDERLGDKEIISHFRRTQ